MPRKTSRAQPKSSSPSLRSRKQSRKRSRPLRIEREGALWLVTTRTVEARYWLHPFLACGLKLPNRASKRSVESLERTYDKRVKRMVADANRQMGPHQPPLTVAIAKRILKGLVGSALARTQEYFRRKGMEVDIFAFVAMSNHLHLVLRTHAKNLAAFMGYFKARVAEVINYVTGRRGPLFARRYDAQEILSDGAASGCVTYIVDNPRAANLVVDHHEWPGLLLCFGLGDADAPTFEYLARTDWHKAKRPDDIERFFQTATLTLSPLPRNEGVERKLYAAMVNAWVNDRKNDQQQEGGPRKSPLGIEGVLNTAFNARPGKPKRTRRNYACGSPDEINAHYDRCRNTIAVYNERADEFLAGNRTVVFPDGTYPPTIPYAA